MKRRVAIIALALLCVFVTAQQLGRIQGKGFYSVVNLPNDVQVKGLDVFVDGEDVLFELDFASRKSYSVDFFDPPERKVVTIQVQDGIKAGQGSLAFSMPSAIAARARGFTLMLDPPMSQVFVYFAITDGLAGLVHKKAAAGIIESAFRPIGVQ
jgi:hypothetical protein